MGRALPAPGPAWQNSPAQRAEPAEATEVQGTSLQGKLSNPPLPRLVEALPHVLGRYMLFDHIGSGGMANIYLAREDVGLGAQRRVVVKKILPKFARDPHIARMLIEEAKLAAQLSHANVTQVFDLGKAGKDLFIAMEYVEGFDLHQLLVRLSKKRVPLPAEFAVFIVREVLRALDYAHRARGVDGKPLAIVHRDVSPSNVLVSFDGEVKLCDFGIARVLTRPQAEDEETTAARARLAGKAAYMSPEMARGEEVNARADIYAAGILLWELCAGRRLIKGTPEEMFAAARAGVIPPLPNRTLPEPDVLQAILDRALAREPMDRYLTAADFLADMEAYAVRARLVASPLKLGAFLEEHFRADIVDQRRAREEAAEPLWQSSFPPSGDRHAGPDVSGVRALPASDAPPRPFASVPPSSTSSVWLLGVGLLAVAAIAALFLR